MKNIKRLIALSLVLVGVIAQAADKPDSLLIHGDNFTISTKAPQGWKGDSTNAVFSRVNLVLYRTNENIQNAKTLIRVLVTKKTDENTAEDLNYDMEGYRKQYPGIQFKDIGVKHPEYRAYAKLFFLEKGFHEYVTYLNPGKKYPYLIAVSMTIPKTIASKQDMQAYSYVVKSVKALK